MPIEGLLRLRVLSGLRARISGERLHRLEQHARRLSHPAFLGTLRRTTPLSTCWGYDRGVPVDRFYIERFLEEHRTDVRGRVLEILDSTYTTRFGRSVERSDVLDVDVSNRRATIVADLATADGIRSDQFTCFILTQTLQLIYPIEAAVRHAYRILQPGGVLLVTVPGISRLASYSGVRRDYWRFTPDSCAALFEREFGSEQVAVRSFGNVLTAIAFLAGMAREELSHSELTTHDADYPVIVAVRAVKQ